MLLRVLRGTGTGRLTPLHMHDLVLPVAVVDEVVSVTFACFVLVLSRRQCASANVVNADDGQTYKSESKESSIIDRNGKAIHACMHACSRKYTAH